MNMQHNLVYKRSTLTQLISIPFMSCLRLRLPPARRAWKSFTSRLHSKLHKRIATHNKARKRVNTFTTNFAQVKPYKFLRLRLQRIPRLLPPFQADRHAHVYVDKLFKEPAFSELVAERCRHQKTPVTKRVIKPIADSSFAGVSKQSQAAAIENYQCDAVTSAADDMWESLAIASPQMDGIERIAEEFIAKFRAETKDQETLARRHM